MAKAELANIDNAPVVPKSALQQRIEMEETLRRSRRKRSIIVFLVTLVLVAMLCVVGFFAGIYLRLLDVNTLNEKLHLYEWPVIGQYFVKLNDDIQSGKPLKIPFISDEQPEESRPVIVNRYEIEKRRREQQLAERKRISKLARLYEEMSPKQAAAIMNELDDEIIIAIMRRMDETQTANILAQLEPARSARLTQILYNGVVTRITN